MRRTHAAAVLLIAACTPSLDVTFVLPAGLRSSSLDRESLSVLEPRAGHPLSCDDVAFAGSTGRRGEVDAARTSTSSTGGELALPRTGTKLLVGEAFDKDLGLIAAGCAEVGTISSPATKVEIAGEWVGLVVHEPSDVGGGSRDGGEVWMRPFDLDVRDAFGRGLTTRLRWRWVLPTLEVGSDEGRSNAGAFSIAPDLGSRPGPYSISAGAAWGEGVTISGVIVPASVEAVLDLPAGTQQAGAATFTAGGFGEEKRGAVAGLVPVAGAACDGGPCWLEAVFTASTAGTLRASLGAAAYPSGTALVPAQPTHGRLLLYGAGTASWWQPLDGGHQPLGAAPAPVEPGGTWIPPCGAHPAEVELVTASGVKRFDLSGLERALLAPGDRTVAAGCLDTDEGVSTAYLVGGIGQRLDVVGAGSSWTFPTAVVAPSFHLSRAGRWRLVGGRYQGDDAVLSDSQLADGGSLLTQVHGALFGQPIATAAGDVTGNRGLDLVTLSITPAGELVVTILATLDLSQSATALGNFSLDGAAFASPALGVADFDGDGIDDIAVIGRGSATLPPRVRVYRMGVLKQP